VIVVVGWILALTSSFARRSDDDHRGRPIADLLVLLLCEIDEDFTGGMLDYEEREDGGTVVGDCYFLQ
jgi:hypothetical protein